MTNALQKYQHYAKALEDEYQKQQQQIQQFEEYYHKLQQQQQDTDDNFIPRVPSTSMSRQEKKKIEKH